MTNQPPFAWARRVDEALRQLDKIPLFANAPQFDIDHLSSIMASHFQAPSLKIEIDDCSWRSGKKIQAGLGNNIMPLAITVSPLSSEIFWLIGREDMAKLTQLMMNSKSRSKAMSSEILQEGFYRYLVLEALDALHTYEPLKEFSLKISDDGDISFENTYCIDVKISYDRQSIWARLVLPSLFMIAWQRHFSSMRELFSLTSMAESLEVPISISTGTFYLTSQELKNLEIGDFVPLNRGGYDPRHHEGIATLSLGTHPLFRVSVKENKIKIIDYAKLNEEPMKNVQEPPIESASPHEEEPSIAIKKLPLEIIVELAKLRMTVDELMKLSPGNLLELPMHPNQEVNLTVNGQKIGRAELVHLGEALGVRIIETA